MAVIWGFDLSEMSWGAFGHARMFDRRWHLRRERFILYQIAMLVSLVAECTATYSLSKYESHQSNIERLSNYAAQVHNNDLIAAACVTIVFCVLVATIFGADFFFLVFWPRRRYPGWYNTTKKVLAVGITLGMAASALMSTIVVAGHASFITGVDASTARQYTGVYSRPPLLYRRFSQNVAWVVLIWLAFISTIAATVIMFISSAHDAKFGTEPKNIIDLNGDTPNEKKHDPTGHNRVHDRGFDDRRPATASTTDETPINRGGTHLHGGENTESTAAYGGITARV